jgi:hypothetical protein
VTVFDWWVRSKSAEVEVNTEMKSYVRPSRKKVEMNHALAAPGRSTRSAAERDGLPFIFAMAGRFVVQGIASLYLLPSFDQKIR